MSKNLDAKLLQNVQVLKNYEDNPLLKKFRKSEKVALNLTIKNSHKNKWFGTILAGIGTNKRYNIKFNLGLLRKEIKLLSLSKINNNGYRVTEQNDNVINLNFNTIQLKEPKAKSVISTDISKVGNLKLYESLLNKSKLTSLTSVSKIGKYTKLRTLFYLSDEDVNFKNNTLQNYKYNTNIISFKEHRNRFQNIGDLYGNVELKHFKSENWYTTFESKWLRQKDFWDNKINTNNSIISEKFNNKREHFFNHFKTTYAPNSSLLWQNYAYLTTSRNNENQTLINSSLPFVFQKDTINQIPQSKNLFFGVNSKINIKKGNSTFAYSLAIENENRSLLSKTIGNKTGIVDSLKINFKQRFFNVNNTLSFIQNLSKKTKISTDISYLYKIDFETKKDFKLPKIQVNLSSNLFLGALSLSAGISKELFDTANLYSGFLIKGYRNLYYNNAFSDTYVQKMIGFSHTLNYANRGFYTTTFGTLVKSNKSILMKEQITQNNSFYYNSIIGKSNISGFLDNHTTAYFHAIKTSFTLSNNFALSENYINGIDNDIVKFKSYSHNIKLKAQTYFKFPINFKCYIKKSNNWNIYKDQNSLLTTTSFGIDADYKINKHWHFNTKLNHYQLKLNRHNFLSAVLHYKPQKSRISYKLKAHNLFNVKSYFQSSNYGYSNYISKTDIIPRYIMFYVNYRF